MTISTNLQKFRPPRMIEELLSDVLRQALKSATPKARTAYRNSAGAQARIGKARQVVHGSMLEQAPDSAFEPKKS